MKKLKRVLAGIGVCTLSLLPVSGVEASEQNLKKIAEMYEQSVVNTLEWNFEFYPEDTFYDSKDSAEFLSEEYSGGNYYFKYYYCAAKDEMVQVLFEKGTDRFRAYVIYNSDCIETSMYIR